MSLLFNMLSSFVIGFPLRSKHLLISCLQSLSTVILESKKRKSVSASTFSPPICHEVIGPVAMILLFWMFSLKPVFSLSSFTLIKRLFRSSSLSAISVLVLHSICQQIWKTQQWPQDWKRSVFIPIPKKGNAKDAQYSTIALISHSSNVMLKILQAMLQQYINRELSDVQAGFRKGRGTRDQIAKIRWII